MRIIQGFIHGFIHETIHVSILKKKMMVNLSQEALYTRVNSMFKKGSLHKEEDELFDVGVSIPGELQVLLKIARRVVSPDEGEFLYRYAIKQIISWILYDFVINQENKKDEARWRQTLFAAVAIELQYLSSSDRNLFIREVLKRMEEGEITEQYLDNPEWVAIVKEEARQYSDDGYSLAYGRKGVGQRRFENNRQVRLMVCVRAIQYAVLYRSKRDGYLQKLAEKLNTKMEEIRVPVAGTAQFCSVPSLKSQSIASAENPEDQGAVMGDELHSIGVELSKKLLNAKGDKVDVNDAISVLQGAIVLSAIGGGYLFAKWTSWDSITQVSFTIMVGIIVGAFSLYGKKRRALQQREGEMIVNDSMDKDWVGEHIGGGEEIR